MSVLQI